MTTYITGKASMATHVPYLTIIYTRFAGATDTRGSRIIATTNHFGKKSRTTHNYLHEYSGDENHKTAAFKLLLNHFDKDDRGNFELIGQTDSPTGEGNAFVFKRIGA
jgi:hypothetical protein